MSEEVKVAVIDAGSHSIRAGFAGGETPSTVIPTIFSSARCPSFANPNPETKDFYIGDNAQSRCGYSETRFPIRHGMILDWEGMEKILHQVFWNELHVEPEKTPVLLSEPIVNPKANRVKTAELMFETFHVPSMCLFAQPALSLFASGRNTAVVVESGDGVTYTVPLIDGFAIPEAVKRCDIAGCDVTEYLRELLKKKGRSFSLDSYSDFCTVRDIKEKLGYVAADFDAEMKKPEAELQKEYELPDCSKITVGNECFRCAELLFHPEMVGLASGGLHEIIYDSIQKCDVNFRKNFFFNILLSGGNTMFKGIEDRLQKEVAALVPSSMKVKVVAPAERKNSTWIGGSIVASLSTFPERCLTKADYAEMGPDSIQKKCPPLVSKL